MRTLRRPPVLLTLVCGLAGVAAGTLPVQGASAVSAQASRPGQWTQVTGKLTNIDDIGLARGSDGVLHVLWTSGGTGSFAVSDTPIKPNGAVGKPQTLLSHIFAANDPDATATSKGLAVFWDAVRNNSPSSPQGIYEATRPSRAGTWSVGSPSPTPFSWLSSNAAAPGIGGARWTTFVNSGGIVVHHAGHPSTELGFATCCVDVPGVGTDAKTGTPWVTYLSTVPKHSGLFAQRLTAAGKRSGAPILLPGSDLGGSPLDVHQRITATGLGGNRPGVYVTYRVGSPVPRSIDLFKLGARSAVKIASFSAPDDTGGTTLAADPFGRVWVAWFRLINNRPALWIRRAKSGASDFGQTTMIKLPSGTANVWKVYLDAQAKKLDVVALLTKGGKTSYWTTQVLPPKQ